MGTKTNFITLGVLIVALILVCVDVFISQSLNTTLTEINNRQKTVIAVQHKAIEDMIRDVCKR